MEDKKIKYLKIGSLIFLFILTFIYAYFLLYAPFKLNDDQLLITTMIFTSFIVAIPLFVFMENNDIEQKTVKNKKRSKKRG